MEFNTTEEIIQDIAAGKMVILLDDEDRENEGDLVCAAELVDDKKINFMISKAKGLVCLPLSPQKCDQLNLPMMTNNNRAKHGTGFTVSIEAAEGISTGISAEDRARTIIAAAKKNAKARDIVQWTISLALAFFFAAAIMVLAPVSYTHLTLPTICSV